MYKYVLQFAGMCFAVLGKFPFHCEVSSVTIVSTVCSNNQNVYPRRKLSLVGSSPGSEVSSAATDQRVSVGKQLSVDEGID